MKEERRLLARAIDRHVGVRLAARRRELQRNERDLGMYVGVTGQQVRNYELGEDRISSGRLLLFARALEVSIDYFYEDAP